MNKVFRALNDPTRREMLQLLRVADKTPGEIATHFNISKPSISHHLDILKQANLVVAERKGQFISYSINTSVLDEIMEWIVTLQKPK